MSTRPFKFYFIGNRSAGKSSLLNSIAGGIISNISIRNGTNNPTEYHFTADKNVDTSCSFKRVLDRMELDKQTRMFADKTNPIYFQSYFRTPDFIIVDFPGFDFNCNKIPSELYKQLSDADCLVYITDASSAFLHENEVSLLKKLVLFCKDADQHCQCISLCVVINKFDKVSGIENTVENIFKKIDNKIPIFKLSSHELLINNIVEHKLTIPINKKLYPEVKKIFQTSNTIITKSQKKSIIEGSISYKYIEFAESIMSDTYYDNGRDCDKFIKFMKNEIKYFNNNVCLLIENKFSKFMSMICNVKNIGDMLSMFDGIYKQIEKYNCVGNFVDYIENIIIQNIDNKSFVTYIMDKIIMSTKWSNSSKKKLAQGIIDNVKNTIQIENYDCYYLYLVVISVKYFNYYDSKLLINLLCYETIWNVKELNKYYNALIFKHLERSSLEHSKYQTEFVATLYYNLIECNSDICLLIELACSEYDHLEMLNFNHKIPYEVVSNYLGKDVAYKFYKMIDSKITRYSVLALNFVNSKNSIPFLFNTKMQDLIKIDMDSYLKLESIIDHFEAKKIDLCII